MKKILALGLVLCMLFGVLCACTKPENPETPEEPSTPSLPEFKRDGITKITAKSQMTDPLKTADIKPSDFDALLSKIESLCVEPLDIKEPYFGWEYYFLIEYENSEPVLVTSLVNQIKVDGVYYSAPHYTPSVFEDYFE